MSNLQKTPANAALPKCDCLTDCGDDDAIDKGTAAPCAFYLACKARRLVEAAAPDLLTIAKEAHQHLIAIHKTVGAPGDWGYDTKMGQALFAFYQWERTLASIIAKAEGRPS